MVHRNAPLTPTGRLRLARCVVEDGWCERRAAERFQVSADAITADLNGALAATLGGQSGMDTAFVQGDTEMADSATSAQGAANFDAARFSGSR